jgi:hypothetical protein
MANKVSRRYGEQILGQPEINLETFSPKENVQVGRDREMKIRSNENPPSMRAKRFEHILMRGEPLWKGRGVWVVVEGTVSGSFQQFGRPEPQRERCAGSRQGNTRV